MAELFVPDAAVAANNGSVACSLGAPPSRYVWSLDRAPFTPCAWPDSFADLSPGVHVFEVRAVDASGNDPQPAAFGCVVVTPLPALEFEADHVDRAAT